MTVVTAYLSPSRLGLHEECRRCFWLAVNEGLRRPSGPFPSLPGGMDRELKAHFDRYRARGDLPPELEGRFDGRLLDDEAFLADARDWRERPVLRDEGLDAVLRGAVDDLLETPDGDLVVLDYKTRGHPPKGDGAPDYYVRQLDCYNLVLRETGHPTADVAYLLYYHPETVRDAGEVAFNVDLVEVPVDVDAARRLFETAVATLEGPVPDSDPDCDFCDWGRRVAAF